MYTIVVPRASCLFDIGKAKPCEQGCTIIRKNYWDNWEFWGNSTSNNVLVQSKDSDLSLHGDLWSDYRIGQIILKRVLLGLLGLYKLTGARRLLDHVCILYLSIYHWFVALSTESPRINLGSVLKDILGCSNNMLQ